MKKYRILQRTNPAVGNCPATTVYYIQVYRLWHWWHISGGYYEPISYLSAADARRQMNKLISDEMPTIDVVVDQ